jgi:hypothetical protein
MRVTRRGLQIALGGLWLLDAALQCQPYMFTKAFGIEGIGSAAAGQPWIASAPVHWAAHLISTQPIATNAVFAGTQLALALGLFWRGSARVALLASIGWAVGVWVFGEGLGGLLGGGTTLLTGAPGAALLYVVLALAAYPTPRTCGDRQPPSAWAPAGWIGTWTVGAALQAAPSQNSAAALSASLRDGADAAPTWLQEPATQLARAAGHHEVYVVALIIVPLLVAVTAALGGIPRLASVVAGAFLATGFWTFGQRLGELLTGQSTDPNTGPLLILLAFATAATPIRRRAAARAPSHLRPAAGCGPDQAGAPRPAPARALRHDPHPTRPTSRQRRWRPRFVSGTRN